MLLAKWSLYDWISNSTWIAIGGVTLWGFYCVAIVWSRVNQKRFKTETLQDQFLDDVEQMLLAGDFEGVEAYCEGQKKAVPQIIQMVVHHRDLGYKGARQYAMDRFSRDVMNEIEYLLSWVSTVIKSAPMLGLFGTVFGMMGAFNILATAESVEPAMLAKDINIALQTTAAGLAIAIPLMILTNTINVRIAKMEDLVSSGLVRFMGMFRESLERYGDETGTHRSASAGVQEAVAVEAIAIE
jgi:biopolymer transport protein ExbB